MRSDEAMCSREFEDLKCPDRIMGSNVIKKIIDNKQELTTSITLIEGSAELNLTCF